MSQNALAFLAKNYYYPQGFLTVGSFSLLSLEILVAEMNDILAAAHRLGTLIGAHPAVVSYRELTRQLDLDISARNLLGQFEQLMEVLAQKEANMQPIEIAEKQQMQTLQQSIQMHPLIKKLSLAERDYRLVMQKVQETINGGLTGQAAPPEAAGAGEAPAAPSKIILD